jgi:hypothetical protein
MGTPPLSSIFRLFSGNVSGRLPRYFGHFSVMGAVRGRWSLFNFFD